MPFLIDTGTTHVVLSAAGARDADLYLPDGLTVELVAPGSGLNVWVPVDDERDALVALAASGIGAAPGRPFLPAADTADHIRLTISAVEDPEPIAAAVAVSARATGSRAVR